MHTTETSAGSNRIAAQRQVLPHTNCYLVPGLSFEGEIFKEQQKAFLTRLILPNLARMFNGQQQTTFLTQEYHGSGPKSLDEGPQGRNCGCLGSLNLQAACVPRQLLPQGVKTRVGVFADIQDFALRAQHSLNPRP